MLCLVTQSCPTPCDPMDCSPTGSSVHRDSPGKNAGKGCYAVLQGIFPTQELNPGLPHCRQILYHLSHRSEEEVKSLSRVRLFATPWSVAYQALPSMGFSRQECWSGLPFPSPRESSQPRYRTQVSSIAGRRFTVCAPKGSPIVRILPMQL